jgi:transposase
MAHVADHLSVSALEQQYRSCTDVTATRHVQTIWLLAKGHTIAEVSATVSFARRWVERLLARYNAQGRQALGDLRRRNGTSPSVLRPDRLDKLTARLREPPPDGGLWTSPKVARWMARELGLAAVLPQRGWEALQAIGWSGQKPRPRHPAAATPEERAAFEKSSSRPSPRSGLKPPDKPIEVWATDEHRIGLKPIVRRGWAPQGQRPIALGHHRCKGLYVTAFVQPISGETFW